MWQCNICEPVDAKLPSPSEILFGRPTRTTIPSYHHASSLQQHMERGDHMTARAERMKADHDKTAGPELPVLYEGQKVRVLNPDDHTWQPATVAKKCDEPRSYMVSTPNGATYRRNRAQIRETASRPQPKRVSFSESNENPDVQNRKPPEPDPDKDQNVKTDIDQQLPKEHPPKHTTTRSGRVSRKPARFRDES
jgi:hypothetical protein